MNTEFECRKLCKANKQNPDGIAHGWHGVPKPKEAGNGHVLNWMTWISTVERKETRTIQSKEDDQRKANLQRMIDETSGGRKVTPRYSFRE